MIALDRTLSAAALVCAAACASRAEKGAPRMRPVDDARTPRIERIVLHEIGNSVFDALEQYVCASRMLGVEPELPTELVGEEIAGPDLSRSLTIVKVGEHPYLRTVRHHTRLRMEAALRDPARKAYWSVLPREVLSEETLELFRAANVGGPEQKTASTLLDLAIRRITKSVRAFDPFEIRLEPGALPDSSERLVVREAGRTTVLADVRTLIVDMGDGPGNLRYRRAEWWDDVLVQVEADIPQRPVGHSGDEMSFEWSPVRNRELGSRYAALRARWIATISDSSDEAGLVRTEMELGLEPRVNTAVAEVRSDVRWLRLRLSRIERSDGERTSVSPVQLPHWRVAVQPPRLQSLFEPTSDPFDLTEAETDRIVKASSLLWPTLDEDRLTDLQRNGTTWDDVFASEAPARFERFRLRDGDCVVEVTDVLRESTTRPPHARIRECRIENAFVAFVRKRARATRPFPWE